nr:hypothetical protein CFP56_22441 [Quercus suber]
MGATSKRSRQLDSEWTGLEESREELGKRIKGVLKRNGRLTSRVSFGVLCASSSGNVIETWDRPGRRTAEKCTSLCSRSYRHELDIGQDLTRPQLRRSP